MTPLRHIDIGIISRIYRKRRIPEVLNLKLVSAGDEVVFSGLQVDTRVDGVYACVEVRPRRAPKWLKADSEWTIDTATVCRESLITDRVAEGLSWTLCEIDSSIEEVAFTNRIRIVCIRNKGSGADIQLCRRDAGLEAKLFGARQRNCFDD